MCKENVESTTHVPSMCSKIAQTLYMVGHDHMLRPIYQYLLHKYEYQESDHSKPWYQQKQPQLLRNTISKVQWNVPFHLNEKAQSNGANRIDMSVWDKVKNISGICLREQYVK